MDSETEFFIHYITEFGKALYITGNSPILGQWDPFKAKRMHWTKGNVWKAQIQNHSFEYKYFVADYYQPYQQLWEMGPNRKFYIVEQKQKKNIIDFWDYREIEFQCSNLKNYKIKITGTTFSLGNCKKYQTMIQYDGNHNQQQLAIYNFQFNPINDDYILFECQAQLKDQILSACESVDIKQVCTQDDNYFFNVLIIKCKIMEQYLMERIQVEHELLELTKKQIELTNKQNEFLDQHSVTSTQNDIFTNSFLNQCSPNQTQSVYNESKERQCGKIEGNVYLCIGCQSNGTVWGSNPYTSNSDICRAAKHAGAIFDQGGKFIVQQCPGYSKYSASTLNGVTTVFFGDYPSSILIMRTDQVGKCGRINENLYYCKGCQSNGVVWGNNPYTSDSDICKAARHAGIITNLGGIFLIQQVQAQSFYSSSTQNGITTNSYGKQGSFYLTQSVQDESKERQCGKIEGNVYLCIGCQSNGIVWGSNPYTSNSDFCRAAKHAGAISDQGGKFIVQQCPGYSQYSASTLNGVTTVFFGDYPSSILIMRTDQVGKCGRINENLYQYKGCQTNGVVCGNNPENRNSYLCKSARQQGIISNEGGLLLITTSQRSLIL